MIATPFTSTMADLKRAVDAVADQKHVEQLKKGVAKWNAWGGVGEIGPAAADLTGVLEQRLEVGREDRIAVSGAMPVERSEQPTRLRV